MRERRVANGAVLEYEIVGEVGRLAFSALSLSLAVCCVLIICELRRAFSFSSELSVVANKWHNI